MHNNLTSTLLISHTSKFYYVQTMKLKTPKQHSFKKTNIKLNPFEVHINRSKHQVLGRKLKSDKGMPGISKHKAIKKRKDTLLQEYKMRHKSSHFNDQRIGERNSDMTEDDRIMARFTAERMRMFNKKTMFNLSESEVLTHRGQNLSEIERFESTRSDDEEDDPGVSGSLKAKFVGNAHFGGGMLTKNKQNRESLIDELINESKKRKAERQRNKEETLEATEKLDEEWKILGQITTSACIEESVPSKPVSNTNEDDYDVVMRQLKFEPHAQASQRLKSDEEIIKEDKEKLEKLEHERLKQLREIEITKLGNHRSSDDIDDGFLNLTTDFRVDDEDVEDHSESSETEMEGECNIAPILKNKETSGLVNNKMKHDTDNSVEEEEFEEEDDLNEVSSGSEPSDESSDEDCAMEDLTDLMPPLIQTKTDHHQSNVPVSVKKKISNDNSRPTEKSTKESTKVTHSTLPVSVDLDLPYVLDVPKNFESFKDLLNNYSIDQQNVILERLLKSNHPTLEPGNKKKILKLAEYIIQYVSESDFTLDKLSNMVLHFSIFKEYNKTECLKMLVDSLSTKFDDGNSSISTSKFLVWFVVLFLKPQGMDVLLPINKAALSFLSKEISETDLNSQSQIKLALLYSYLLVQDAKGSSIVYTDAVVFLNNCLVNCLVNNRPSDTNNQRYVQEKNRSNEKNNLLEDLKLYLSVVEETECSSHQIIYLCVNLLADFVKLYRKYPQSKIMFKRVHNTVSKIEMDRFPNSLKESIKELKTLLDILQTATLPPVIKAAKKPKALRQYEPSFHVITEGKRSLRGLPAEKQEEQKLLHKYKSEMKGAMRELRRDRVFLANVKLGEKARSDAERIKKVKEIFGTAAAQQGELRSLKRKK